ncbi:FBP domain-containing protein [Streptomyces antimicrobicus]|uniref:FBP domain-containing protein n=1 Tax=Streptomyces antimicrobicus TaxID=2883108 RepID=A0ABS8BAC5_9ACTN|nr:FBP domain-containing protein [Streptomyces antimicrobicus]MCB5181577.1 FBP domain-containing protein [Streptomyces antimicrobicus]
MKSLTEKEIRGSFLNCSKGEAARLPIPRDLDSQRWDDLDFLGWRDLSAPDRSYLVADLDGTLTGIALRFPATRRSLLHRSICGLCMTVHAGSGVSLMTARKRGKEGRDGNSVGLYMCTDLACSLYVRGLKQPEGGGGRFEETLTLEEQIERLRTNLAKFAASL